MTEKNNTVTIDIHNTESENKQNQLISTDDSKMVNNSASSERLNFKAWLLFGFWAATTSLSQVFSGKVLVANGNPGVLITVQSIMGLLLQLIVITSKKFGTLLNNNSSHQLSHEKEVITSNGQDYPILANIFILALNAVGMLSAHLATSALKPCQSQVLKNSEIAFAYLFSSLLGVSVGRDPGKVRIASLLVVIGTFITVLTQLKSTQSIMSLISFESDSESKKDSVGVIGGVGWAAISCVCFGMRGVMFKLLKIKEAGVDSFFLSSILITSALIGIVYCIAIDPDINKCFEEIGVLLLNSSAALSGVMWFSYQWASFSMLKLISPVQHTILNNAKRAIVTVSIFIFFPMQHYSLLYFSGVGIILLGVAVLAM